MEIKVIKNVDINELDLSVRTWNCLRRAGIDRVQDIADNYHNLDRVRNLPQKSIDEINKKIKPYAEFVERVRITNYDRIKAMSVEEMAEEYAKLYPPYEVDFCGKVSVVSGIRKDMFRHALKMNAIKWLLQEVSDNA